MPEIFWVRHAESCSNYASGHITDKKVGGGSRIEPVLTYVGMQQAILFGNTTLRKSIIVNDFDIIICSAKIRTVMTAMLACRHMTDKKIYVVPYVNEVSRGLFGEQNLAISSDILSKNISFIKKWLNSHWINNFDDVEVVNDIAFIKKYTTEEIKTRTTPSTLFKNMITILQKIIKQWTDPVDLISLNYMLDKYTFLTKNPKEFIEGLSVDFSYYKTFENMKNVPDVTVANKNAFYELVLPLIKQNKKILCVSHGNFMRELLENFQGSSLDYDLIYQMKNTQMIKEIDHTFEILNNTAAEIRTNYDGLEENNQSMCTQNGLAGLVVLSSQPCYDKYIKYKTKFLQEKLKRQMS